jgi:hypothetical protein
MAIRASHGLNDSFPPGSKAVRIHSLFNSLLLLISLPPHMGLIDKSTPLAAQSAIGCRPAYPRFEMGAAKFFSPRNSPVAP